VISKVQNNVNISKTIAKSSLSRFLGKDTEINRQIFHEIEHLYIASEITYLFQNFSKLLFDIFLSAAGAFIFYKVSQQKEDRKSREIFNEKIETLLEGYTADLNNRLKRIEEKIDQFDRRDKSYIQSVMQKQNNGSEIQIKDNILSQRKRRLKNFRNIKKKLRPSKKATHLLIEIIEKEYEINKNIDSRSGRE
jgi:hypothetical protein